MEAQKSKVTCPKLPERENLNTHGPAPPSLHLTTTLYCFSCVMGPTVATTTSFSAVLTLRVHEVHIKACDLAFRALK